MQAWYLDRLRLAGIAVASVAVAMLASLVSREAFGVKAPHFFFASAVVFSSFYGRIWAGLLTSMLGTIVYTYFVVPPAFSLAIRGSAELWLVVQFFGEGVILTLLTEALGVTQRLSITRSWWRFVASGLAILLGALLKLALPNLTGESPYALFYAAVLFSTWCGGIVTGLLAVSITALLAVFFFHEPLYSFHIADPRVTTGLLVFLLEGSAIVALCTRAFEARQAAERAEREKRRLDLAIRRQNAALVELAHDSDSANVEATLHRITAIAARTLECGRVSVWLFGPERERLRCIDLYEQRIDRHSAGNELLASEYPAYFHELEQNRTLPADDARSDLRTSEFTDRHLTPLGITSILNAPIRCGGKMLGVVCHEHVDPTPRCWAMEEQQFAGSIGDLIALTLEEGRRLEAEQHVREQAVLLAQAQEAIVVQDGQERITFWNRGAERIYGFSAEEALGQPAESLGLTPPEPMRSQIAAALAESGQWHGELNQFTRARKEITVASRWTLVRDPEGKPRGALVINADITQQKQIEAQLHRSQRLESIGALAGGIAHDLNNMLTPISMAIELLQLPAPEKDRLELLATLQSATERGSGLVRQILTFARGGGKRHEPIAIRSLLAELERLLRRTFPRSVEVRVSTQGEVWQPWGDPLHLHQVLMNLCVNARDAMPDGGVLSLRAENVPVSAGDPRFPADLAPGNYVALRVADTGVGIPEEIRERIFDPFFTTKETGRGTGLGLSTASSLVRVLGGTVQLRSAVGKGTEFTVYLPAVLQEVAAAKEDSTPPAGCGETILLIDEDGSIREVARLTLEANGYKVLTATDARSVLSMAPSILFTIQVAIFDSPLSDLGSAAAASHLRRHAPAVRFIVTTGRPSRQGADVPGIETSAHLPKPYTTPMLLRGVRAVIEGESE